MDGFMDLVRAFSFRSSLRSNIVSSTGSFLLGSGTRSNAGGSAQYSGRFTGCKTMSSYYSRTQEITDYEGTELSNTVVNILRDYVITYFSDTTELISIKNSANNHDLETAEKRINDILDQLRYTDDCKDHLSDIIFHGSFCYRLTWNNIDKKYDKDSLVNPYNVIDVLNKGSYESRLVTSSTGKIMQVPFNTIIRLGNCNLRLRDDITNSKSNSAFTTTPESEEKNLVDNTEYKAASPLYYNICNKIKEYILKDQVISLLSIKDLIQPLILLLRVDKNTPIDAANRLSKNAENLINKYSDISAILSERSSIADLIDSLLNNIKVLPDYNSGMGAMDTVDLSKITNKINEIRGEQDNNRAAILNSIGIPYDLFEGRSTKFEALKTSERLNSAVNFHCKAIDQGLKNTAAMLYNLITGQQIDPGDFKSNIFTKTAVEYTASISSAEVISNLLANVTSILDTATQTAKTNDIINITKYYTYVVAQLKQIDPDIANLVSEEDIKSAMESIQREREAMAQQ